MKKERIEEYLEKISEGTDFCFRDIEETGDYLELYAQGDNPENEDWSFNVTIPKPKDERELLELLHKEIWDCYNNFDIEEQTYLMLEAKRNGLAGVPGVVDLVRNEEYKENALKEFTEKLTRLLDSVKHDAENKRDKKYAAIITQESERYTRGEVDLSYFGDHPLEGDFVEIVFGDTYEELMDDGRNEGLFYLLIALETDEIIGKGIFDPCGPADEIEAYEQRISQNVLPETKTVIGAKEFRSRVITKLKQVNPDIKSEDLYFSQTAPAYFIDYKPNYPENSNGDFTVSQDHNGFISLRGNFDALIPTIRSFNNIEDFERRL